MSIPLSASGVPTAHDAVLRAVVAAVTEILPDVAPGAVTLDTDFAALGADSVDRVEILTLLTHELGRSDELSVFAGLSDIGALVSYLGGGNPR